MPKNKNQTNTPETSNSELQHRVKSAVEVFDRYSDTIRDMIRFQSNDTSHADDIFQDFFLSLVRKPIPPKINNMKRYLSKALRNDIIDAKRRKTNYHERISRYARTPRPAPKQKIPPHILIQSEQFKIILALIKKELRPHEANALMYRFIHNLDIADAAEKMNINKRSFSRYLCVALKKMRRLAKKRKQNHINKHST